MQDSDPRTSSGTSRTMSVAPRLVPGAGGDLCSRGRAGTGDAGHRVRHRLASEVIPVVQPLLEPGGAITGMDGTLFVRTSPANLAQILQAVESLDRQPRQLLLSMGQGTVTNLDSSSVSGSATIGDGDVQVGVNRPPGAESGASVRVGSRAQRADLTNVSTVRALEGMETFIAVGQSVPMTTTQVTRGWGGTTAPDDRVPLGEHRLLRHRTDQRRDGHARDLAAAAAHPILVPRTGGPDRRRLDDRQWPAWRVVPAGRGAGIGNLRDQRSARVGPPDERVAVLGLGQGRRGPLIARPCASDT